MSKLNAVLNTAPCDLSFWQDRTSHQLSEEDIRQIKGNISGFFLTLQGWSVAEGGQNV